MKTVHIERFAYTPWGTFGELRLDGWTCLTCEPPWKDNQVGKSCIPEGVYGMVQMAGLRKPLAEWQLVNVPGRSAIEFHVGNSMLDTEGCILLGSRPGWVDQHWAILDSRTAMTEFNRILRPEHEARLLVTRI